MGFGHPQHSETPDISDGLGHCKIVPLPLATLGWEPGRECQLLALEVGDRGLTPTTSCKMRAPPETGREFLGEITKRTTSICYPTGLVLLLRSLVPSTNAVSFIGITLAWAVFSPGPSLE